LEFSNWGAETLLRNYAIKTAFNLVAYEYFVDPVAMLHEYLRLRSVECEMVMKG